MPARMPGLSRISASGKRWAAAPVHASIPAPTLVSTRAATAWLEESERLSLSMVLRLRLIPKGIRLLPDGRAWNVHSQQWPMADGRWSTAKRRSLLPGDLWAISNLLFSVHVF